MKNIVILFISSIGVYILTGLFNISTNNPITINAASQDIVISEIQIAGETANDEFVELYNPTMETVDLTGWRLSRRPTSASSSVTSLVSNMSGVIQPKSYFLIANPNFTGSTSPDLYYSATTSGIAANNTVILYRDNGVTVVDKVGMGTAEDVEGSATIVPPNGTSLERKAHTLATETTMGIGGLDESMGNGFDSDNNGIDFVNRQTSQPQNSVSSTEPSNNLPSPTPTLTLSPSITPTITTHPTITSTPTPTNTPTIQVTSTPTVTPSLLPTPTPQMNITPTPRIKDYFFPPVHIICSWTYKSIRMGWGRILWIPKIQCSAVSS